MTRYRSDSRSVLHSIVDLLAQTASGLGAGLCRLRRRKRHASAAARLRVIDGGKISSGGRPGALQTRPRLRVVGER